MQKALSLVSSILLLSILVACSSPTRTASPNYIPDPTQTQIPPSPVPPTESVPQFTETPTATPLPPAPERASYEINTDLDYANKTVTTDQTILYPNHTGETLTELVLAIVPNLWPNCFSLTSLSVDEIPLSTYNLSGQKLDFALPAPLEPEGTVSVSLQYTLNLPFIEPNNPSQERPRIFGYTDRQINLTNWYPFIVPYEAGTGWVLHDPWYYGEHLVYDAVDFVVDLKTDPSVVVATSGAIESNGESTRYTLTAGRTFAISASTDFEVSSTQVGDVTVSSYYFPLYETPGKAVLQSSAEAIQVYSDLFGPYPHKTLAAVMGDFNDGMEFSALYFHSRGIYNLYNGTPQNLTVAVAVHETAHQWWFERVANDQALNPWLDEALCAYSERIFYGVKYPDLVPWWWQYWTGRVGGTQAWDTIDISIYQGGGFTPYTNTVYLLGAHFLEDLRTRIGDEAFFSFLKDYATQMDGKIATPQDFFAILRQHTSVDFSDLVMKYFQNSY